MASMADLRERSAALFTELARAEARRPRGRRPALAGRASFSWFDADDAGLATALSFRLSAAAASRARPNDALVRALDDADGARAEFPAGLVRAGLALFVTHNVRGRLLAKPRTVAVAPGLFSPPRARGGASALSLGGLSPGLDYWREDALANEHHEHWHQVYPYRGLPPRDFTAWATATPRQTMIDILDLVAPGRNWAQLVPGATITQLAGLFAQVVDLSGLSRLPRDLYRAMFTLNDRQGELFFYMHEQMLARYDAELLSNGLDPVEPFGPDRWAAAIEEGYQPPTELNTFGPRPQGRQLPADAVDTLAALQQEIDVAVAARELADRQGGTVPIDRTLLGEAVESTARQLRELDEQRYGGLHNAGHGFIAALSTPDGVMTSTTTAIRDQVFWRWHKHIDDINAGWQETQPRIGFADAPPVLLRSTAAGRATAWASPDIILCRTVDLPDGDAARQALGEQLFGGANWATSFTAGPAGQGLETIDTLTTTMATVQFGGRAVRYLTHEPFSWFLRIENSGAADVAVTVRIFLAPAATAAQRRAWIELDKFPVTVPAGTKQVVHRADTESSVVKRPVDLTPAAALGGGSGPDEDSYCDCGWPYTLLLPRGTSTGMDCRIVVLCTDGTIDQVPGPEQCGSTSYCGAVSRYPDTRDMGYPFARRFPAAGIERTITGLASAAGRTVHVQHV